MPTNPFQIARWALVASFALMVLVVCLPNPHPSPAWELAQRERYERRFPELKTRVQPTPQADIQFAEGKAKDTSPQPKLAKDLPQQPLRTASLPERPATGDQRANAVRMEQPVFFPDDRPLRDNLAPDPVHLEPPRLGGP